MTALLTVGSGLLGLIVGSFLNVVIHRVPNKESVVRPASRCPACGAPISPRDNIPVLSWLLLRGRCRSCGAAISARYPLVELVTAVLFAAVTLRLGVDPVLPAVLVTVAALLAISVIDLDHFIVPNRIVYPALFTVAVLLLVAAAAGGDWRNLLDAALGGAVSWGLLLLIHLASPGGMGFGDVRLAALTGTAVGWFGLGHVLLGLFLGFLTAAIVGVGLIVSRRRGRKDKLPFGPFLAAGAVLSVLWGRQILSWYLGG